jgi:hypothetical protein
MLAHRFPSSCTAYRRRMDDISRWSMRKCSCNNSLYLGSCHRYLPKKENIDQTNCSCIMHICTVLYYLYMKKYTHTIALLYYHPDCNKAIWFDHRIEPNRNGTSLLYWKKYRFQLENLKKNEFIVRCAIDDSYLICTRLSLSLSASYMGSI